MSLHDYDGICISCGCSEFDPCTFTHRGIRCTCAWIVVDRRTHRGVCSTQKCRAHLNRWDRGDRELSDQAKRRAGAKAHG